MKAAAAVALVVCGTVLIVLPLVLSAVVMLSLDSPSSLIEYRTYGLLPGAVRWVCVFIGAGMVLFGGLSSRRDVRA